MWTADLQSQAESSGDKDQIDRLCDRFETDLKAGRKPNLTELLGQVPAESQTALLWELFLVSLEYARTSPCREGTPEATEPDHSEGRPKSKDASTMNGTHLAHTKESVLAPAVEPMHVEPSRVIGGYEVLGELGRGGMGVVYRARQLSVGRQVALKVIHSSRFQEGDDARRAVLLERFRTEAKAASRLDHENIATVYEVGEFEGHPYYAMRLVEGTSLGKLVETDALPADRAVRYLMPIARAIGKLHSLGVLHRDLKPSNILIDETADVPVLADFGLAKLIDSQQNVTLTDEGFGSPPYMAPEQVLHATSAAAAADIYSLGATLYHLLTGRPPFQAATPAEIARQIIFCQPTPPRKLKPAIARDLETICLKCLEKDEDQRYATAIDLADDLQRFLDHRPITAKAPSRVGRLSRWCRRNPAWSALVAVSCILLTVTLATTSIMYVREQLASAATERALVDTRLTQSNKLFNRSRFVRGEGSYASLPWLIGCLRLDVGTPRAVATRQRINSIFVHGPDLAQIFCHERPISCGALNRAGNRVITAGSDGIARIWSTSTGKCLQVLEHSAPVRQALFNHRGDLAVTASDDAVVQIWTVSNGQRLGAPLAHPGYVKFAEFSHDDEFLVTASSDDRVRIWNVRDGALHAAISAGDGSPISSVAISPDGSRGIAFLANRRGLLWNLRSAEVIASLETPDVVNAVQFSPDATAIVTGDAAGNARVYDVDSRQQRFQCSHSSAVQQVGFEADGQHVVTVTHDAARIWSLDSPGSPRITIVHEGLKSVVMDPTSAVILTIGGDRAVRMWNAKDGSSLETALVHGDIIGNAQFSHDGGSILTYSTDGTARIWSRKDRLGITRLADVPRGAVTSVTADGRWILVWSEAGTGYVLRADSHVDHVAFKFTHDKILTAAAISSDARWVAATDANGNLVIWDRDSGQSRIEPSQHSHAVRAITFTANGKVVATGDAAGHVRLRHVETGEILKTFALSDGVVELIFSPCEDLLIAADSKSARLVQLDSKDNAEVSVIPFGGEITGTRFSPDGNFVVIYGSADYVLVWNIANGSLKSLRTGAHVNDACFSQNSSRLLTIAEDGTAQTWSVVDGSVAHEPIHHSSPLTRGAFSPDGQSVSLCDVHDTVRIWQLETAQPLTIRLHHTGRIVCALFTGPRQLITVTERGEIRDIDASPSAVEFSKLETTSMVLCGHFVDAAGKLVPLSRSEFVRRYRELDGRSGSRF